MRGSSTCVFDERTRSRSSSTAVAHARCIATRRRRKLTPDPRVGLRAGWLDAGEAIHNMKLVSRTERPDGFFDPKNPGSFRVMNSDLAFKGTLAFQGSFNGFMVWDIADPVHPRLRASMVCPGGQADLSVYGNLLFMSVEERRARVDCGAQGVRDSISAERFEGVRVFDISDLDHPKQVAAVQTCRASHTHTLITDPKDKANLYVYVSGYQPVRPSGELAGCSPEIRPPIRTARSFDSRSFAFRSRIPSRRAS